MIDERMLSDAVIRKRRRRSRPIRLGTKPPTCDHCGSQIGPEHPRATCAT